MPVNTHFSHAVQSEQHLYEDIVVESLRMYGQEVFYLPRKVVEENDIFNEEVQASILDAYSVEMYIENTDGFEGEGDLLSKFGVEIRDQATFIISVRTWERFISLDENLASSFRPNEGDLIYLPLSGSMFEIKFVEHEDPFYQIGKLFVFKMRCELFEYANEDFDTDVLDIDQIEDQQAYIVEFTMAGGGSGTFAANENVKLSGTDDTAVVGEVVSWRADTRILKLKDVTRTFQVNDVIVGIESAASHTIQTITDVLTMANDGQADNLEFENNDGDYLDLSETNPFGEP